MLTALRSTVVSLLVLTVVTGILYPLLVTAIAQLVFPGPAGGSILLNSHGQALGSGLIGQPFDDPQYFWGRPSATVPFPYNAASSAGANDGPLHPALLQAVQRRMAALHAADLTQQAPIPVDLVTASGSGLDPHISPAAAAYQAGRVARLRGMDAATVQRLVAQHTAERTWGILGEPRVNVLQLNLALDTLQGHTP